MKSIWNIINENRKECIKFLEGKPDEKYIFAEYDEEEREWMNPHSESEDKSCYPEDVAPFVTYADDDGNVSEYIVTEIYLLKTYDFKRILCAKVVNVQDYRDHLETPVNSLYGASECYIYEMMMDLKLVERESYEV